MVRFPISGCTCSAIHRLACVGTRDGFAGRTSGGRGRTGTALVCLAVLDGVPVNEAVAFVRERYDARAVETPWQRRYVVRFYTS